MAKGSRYKGTKGDDVFAGSKNNDTAYGVEGNDTLDGKAGDDKIYGGTGDDILKGGTGDDILKGDAGDDTLLGGSGADILAGGAGADILTGGTGLDAASYSTSKTGVTVDMIVLSRNTGDAFADQYQTIEDLIGSTFDDSLSGNTKSNTIYGGLGNDRIDGGGGNDELLGEEGADTFVFSGLGSATDLRRMNDFDAEDHIELSRAGFGLHPQYKLTFGSTFVVANDSPAANTNSPTFLFEQSTGLLYFDADGNGSGASFLIASLIFEGQQSLDVSDLVIV